MSKEQVKFRGTSKNFRLNFHLWKCRYPVQLPIWSVTCLHLCKRTCPMGLTRWFTSEHLFWNWRAST